MHEEPDHLKTSVTLLKNLASDRADAWFQFYNIYRGIVLGVAKRMGLDEQSSTDVLQEVMIDFSKISSQFTYDENLRIFLANPNAERGKARDRTLGGFRQWLFMVVKRKVWKHQRRRRDITFTELFRQGQGGDAQDRHLSVADPRPTPDVMTEERCQQNYALAMLEEAIYLLPECTKRSHPRKLAIFLALKQPHVFGVLTQKLESFPEHYRAELRSLRELMDKRKLAMLSKESIMQHYAISSNHVDQEVKAIRLKLTSIVGDLAAGRDPRES